MTTISNKRPFEGDNADQGQKRPRNPENGNVSGLLVKNPFYDNCMNQIQYLKKMFEKDRPSSYKRIYKKDRSSYKGIYKKIPYYTYTLRHNRSKMSLFRYGRIIR